MVGGSRKGPAREAAAVFEVGWACQWVWSLKVLFPFHSNSGSGSRHALGTLQPRAFRFLKSVDPLALVKI